MTYEKLIEMLREDITRLLAVQRWKAGDTIPNDLIMQVLLLGIYDRLVRIEELVDDATRTAPGHP